MKPSILCLTRDTTETIVLVGLNKHATLYYDVCKALSEGKKQEAIAEMFNIDDRVVRKIKSEKCPDCGLSRGKPKKT